MPFFVNKLVNICTLRRQLSAGKVIIKIFNGTFLLVLKCVHNYAHKMQVPTGLEFFKYFSHLADASEDPLSNDNLDIA
jgi:hypothetical protein